MEFVNKVVESFGGGNLTSDAILIVAAVIGLVLIGLLGYFSRDRGKLPLELDRVISTLGHKVSKLETEVSSRKSDQGRQLELLRAELEFLREEIKELRIVTGILPATGPLSRPQDTAAPLAPGATSAVDTFISPAEAVRRTTREPDSEVFASPKAYGQAAEPAPLARKQTLSESLVKSRRGIFSRLRSYFSTASTFDPQHLEDLEETLISADLGIFAVQRLMDELRNELAHGRVFGEEDLVKKIKTKILTIMDEPVTELRANRLPNGPLIVMVVGVNGVGKTTTCAKMAARWKEEGKRVLLIAADTFRAAAVDQLVAWAERLGVDVVSGAENAKPQTVVYDGMKQAAKGQYDIVLIDTAGRLHNKSNLMQELEGIRNAIDKHEAGAPHEVILVVDGSTGQNAMNQAREFHSSTPITGLIVTKLDGTAKCGIVVAIKQELAIPVRFIGVGEGPEDLRPFVSTEFVDALFDDRGLSMEDQGITDQLSAHGQQRRRRRHDSSDSLM